MSRSVSASTSTSVPGLFASGSEAYGGKGNLFGIGKTLDLTSEVLEESPVKQSTLNGAVYKPIFDDDDISLRPDSTSRRGMNSRTVSAPAVSFFGRKADTKNPRYLQPMPAPRRVNDFEPNPSAQALRLDSEDERMEEGESAPAVSLLAPTPVKGDKNGKWKGKTATKPKKGKELKSKLELGEDEEGTEGDDSYMSELSVMEIGWRVMGPLHTSASTGDNDEEMQDADDDDENSRFIPPVQLRSMSRRAVKDNEEEPESVEIDVPDEMKGILQLSPTKPKVDDEMIVEDMLSGKGDRRKRAEVWLPGDGGDESDDWESEGAGWWEAEL